MADSGFLGDDLIMRHLPGWLPAKTGRDCSVIPYTCQQVLEQILKYFRDPPLTAVDPSLMGCRACGAEDEQLKTAALLLLGQPTREC
jgi:hypothetical protein